MSDISIRDKDFEIRKKIDFLKKYDMDFFEDSMSEVVRRVIDFKFQIILKRKDLDKSAKKKAKLIDNIKKRIEHRREIKQNARDIYELPNLKRTVLSWFLDGDVDAKDIVNHVKLALKYKKISNKNKQGWKVMDKFKDIDTVLQFKEGIRDLRSETNFTRRYLENEGLFGVIQIMGRNNGMLEMKMRDNKRLNHSEVENEKTKRKTKRKTATITDKISKEI